MANSTPVANRRTPSNPLIPEKYLDIPSQRLYYLSLGLLCQAIKALDFVLSFASGDRTSIFWKWLFVDFTYCVVLSQLRIPRLQYSRATVLLQVLLLWFLNAVMFGGITINGVALLGGSGVVRTSSYTDISSTSESFGLKDLIASLTFGLIASSSASSNGNLLGQHTVRMSPISTAHLNPLHLNFCLSSSTGFVLLPVILNNTNLGGLKYSLTPLGYPEHNSRIEAYDLSARELRLIEQNYREKQQAAIQLATPKNFDDYDEYDDDDETQTRDAHSNLQRTQELVHIMLTRPGIVRLERVYDANGVDARMVVSQAVVVPCPRVQFAKDETAIQDPIRCVGQLADPQLKIKVHGVPPLSLRWLKSINGEREEFLVEGIEGERKDHAIPVEPVTSESSSSSSALVAVSRVSPPQEVTVPLTVSLALPGTYLYALEEITDGVGNTVRVETDSSSSEAVSASATATTRSFIVLRKPAISFQHCSSDRPTSLLIGSEAKLNMDPSHMDDFDKPWDLDIHYEPPVDDPTKRSLKPWKKTLKYDGERRDLSFKANAPGDYKILGLKGKYCTGTVLAPDSCRVVEKPLPSAEIEWKRIHECSGDTGVSASLILHGTPPFQIYYQMKRDQDAPREISKSFASSRADLTLQPERSGHYVFSFSAISDANYRKIELQGPSIDQMIHPVASAEFSESHGTGRGKKLVSTCSGDAVDINVDLRGTAPWNIAVQIIGPHQAETLHISGIDTPRKKIPIPIPKELQKTGGSFEIALVSVEDASKCKRPVSVPGIEVKVRRVVPTVQFYGKEGERQITITENQKANLPLRLTGDGPWRIKYKRQDSSRTQTASLHSRNSELSVFEKGTYEILSVTDSQCPGAVVFDASTYTVDWVPRPAAKLSTATDATYEAHNGSYILQPICEAVNGHVDLELTGQPPFQIMYNIAQDNDNGGTKLMGQPTFNSIQPRTRFQLHTSTPGRMYYEVKQIGDASYPLNENKDTIIPRSERLLFEQQVSIRPTAQFKNRNRLQYCLNDNLVPLEVYSDDGTIALEGAAPFILVLSIKNIAASYVDKHTIQVPTNTWRLDLPEYAFSTVGAHLISIESVTDSSSCEQAALDPLLRSIWVDVAETAAIVPFEKRDDICVGDITQFQLEGIPPWSIGYKVNGKSHTQEARTSPFSLLQQQPGLFTVTSIAHQQKMCKAAITDLRFNVHALPSASVGDGKKIIQDIHEGDQAEILFTLVGEPPFTITYQRSELPTRKGATSKVLETHTVSRIQTHEYSIFSALEGTWTVTSISDRYCRYPPVQPDMTFERHK
ncbi:hypothetical protein CPB83DRAFT_901377 [Crepidotus variabilis]|uniref:Nucleoporin Pom152 n=1 Tax=Crepidotus variabilis TaxID=179855 RepID=A0A9P6EVP2_9AGAR|nr:hypothetical protein CPB83DRAFT_901377 [Crepidotus variabilis]